MKQTAVEFLVEQITNSTMPVRKAIEQAKEMEKEQIIESYSSGYTDASNEYRFNREYYSTKYTLKSE